MSNGDEDPETAGDGSSNDETVSPAAFEDRFDEAAAELEAAETESNLDGVEAHLDSIESDLEAATVESPGDGDADDEEPEGVLTERLETLRDDLAGQRGPYAEDIADELGSAGETITSSEWTDEGLGTVATAVDGFLETTGETLGESFPTPAADPEDLADGLETVASAVESAGLDPDEDATTIATLLEAAEGLTDDLDDAEVLGDLEIRGQLEELGFYDVLTPRNRTDFPPEWNAIRIYEARGEVEPILTALEKLDSEFMQENALDAIEHMAPEAAVEDVQALAKRRNLQPVRILGRIGDDSVCDMLHDFLGGGDTELEKTTLQALGAIGSDESTAPVAQRLVADDPAIRSAAARALGLLGDTRAIEPLAVRLDEDDDERVRASAAWALNQIGTERALETVAEHADDRSYLVQAEAETVTGA